MEKLAVTELSDSRPSGPALEHAGLCRSFGGARDPRGPIRGGALGRLRLQRAAVYRFVARHRHHLIRGGLRCLVPTPEARARFLS